MITMVYPSNIMQIWPQTIEILEPAIALNGTHNAEDVRKSLLCGNSQLWVQWHDEDKKVEAAVTTEFKSYPRGVWLNFWLAGAQKAVKPLWEDFFNVLTNFAKANNCMGIEDCGRMGWSHYCPDQVRTIGTVRRMNFGNG